MSHALLSPTRFKDLGVHTHRSPGGKWMTCGTDCGMGVVDAEECATAVFLAHQRGLLTPTALPMGVMVEDNGNDCEPSVCQRTPFPSSGLVKDAD